MKNIKSYVVQIEDNEKTDKKILMQIIKALAEAGIKLRARVFNKSNLLT